MEKTKKQVKGTLVPKHETEAIWHNGAEGEPVQYVPKKGEQVLYDPDDKYPYTRIKYGDGENIVKDLPFAGVGSGEEIIIGGNNIVAINPGLKIDTGNTNDSDQVIIGGYYNKQSKTALFTLGCGLSSDKPPNAFEVMKDGTIKSGENNKITTQTSHSIIGGCHNTAITRDSLVVGVYNAVNFASKSLIAGSVNKVEGTKDQYFLNNIIGGAYNKITADNGLVFGESNTLSGNNSLVGGNNVTVSASCSLAVGSAGAKDTELPDGTKLIITEGLQVKGKNSIGIGVNHKVEGQWAGAFGAYNYVYGAGSFAFGRENAIHSGLDAAHNLAASFAFGNKNKVSGVNSFALGVRLSSTKDQIVLGKYNVEDSAKAFILGRGTSTNNPKNIFTVSTAGDGYFAGKLSVGGTEITGEQLAQLLQILKNNPALVNHTAMTVDENDNGVVVMN